MNLDKKTLFEVLQTANNKDYFLLAKYLKGKNLFDAKELNDQPFGIIKEIQYILQKEDFENYPSIITKVCNIEQPENLDFFDYFYQWNWILQELEKIKNREDEFLGYEPTNKEIAAGVENLYKFGSFATIDKLAGGDILKYKEVEKMPYHLVFTKLYLEKTTAEYMAEYSKIKK